MTPPSLQDAIDQAGSPMHLLWKPNAPTWAVPVVDPEYVGWSEEQAAWRDNVSIADLSYHMSDLFIDGTDATKLLSAVSANNFEKFVDGQAKQFIPVTPRGHIITDGILMRRNPNSYILSGVPAAQNWVAYHAQAGDYDVECRSDPDSSVRTDRDPETFRMQIQGPRALDLVAKAFGGPLPEIKFFHSTEVGLAGRSFRAFRHGMAGMPGYEFLGSYEDHDAVKESLMEAGEEFGLVHIGGLAYFTNGVESGWIPTPTPGIYDDPELADYRRFVSLYSFEGMRGLNGSFFSPDVEDYYLTPYELGYGRSINLNHDFIGRDALVEAKENVTRTRVTLEFDVDDVARVFGDGYMNNYGRHRVEIDGSMVGLTFQTSMIGPVGTVLSLAVLGNEHAEPGRDVEVVYGEHPGHGTDPDADLGFPRLRATVRPSPYNEYARTGYRKD